MKLITQLMIIVGALIFLNGCSIFTKSNLESVKTAELYVICEGNFGLSNSSLWNINIDDNVVNGPIFQTLTGSELGDIAQSLAVYKDRLYIVVNNSHVLRVLDLGPEISFSKNIQLPNSSPREMVIQDNFGYVSCWNLEAILKLDLDSDIANYDTIPMPGKPEGLAIKDNYLYVSIIMNTDWSNSNQVVKISLANLTVESSYTVIAGPGPMLFSNGDLFVSSTYYDQAWNKYGGLSKIDLQSGTVQKVDYGSTTELVGDLLELDGQVQRVTGSGLMPVNSDLSLDSVGVKIELQNIYSVNRTDDKIIVGTTDFQAPDSVRVFDLSGNLEMEFTVGVLPGDIISVTE